MARKVDKREEGLRELAAMIAEAYYRRITGEINTPLRDPDGETRFTIDESEIIKGREPADTPTGWAYTEYVRVENFVRNKKKKGGSNVTDKRNIRNSMAAATREDQAGD
jgi:hypothetical protein